MTKVISSAALATLVLDQASKDVLVRLVASLASPLQLKVVQKKKHSLSLTLLSGVELTQRNAILRALCGMALHNALDAAPYYLLGGHSSCAKASPVSALALAGVCSWQSVAAKVREDPSSESDLLDQLNTYLTTRAYLVPGASPTLADLDLCLALLETPSLELENHHVHVRRWLEECHATMVSYAGDKVAIPTLSIDPTPMIMPVFCFGNETNLAPAVSAPSKAESKKEQQPAAGGGLTEEQKRAAAEKRAKKNAEKAKKKKPQQQQQQQPAAVDLNISALDIRVGKIVKVWHHAEAEKLFCEEVDVGEDKPRQIASGLRPFYKESDLENRSVLVLCNLKARNLVGFPSHGMVLCASNADHTKVEFVLPPESAKIGERVMFEPYKGEPEPENKVAKKKYFEKLAPDLKTNGEGIVVWKDAQAMTSAGPVKAINGMPDAQVS